MDGNVYIRKIKGIDHYVFKDEETFRKQFPDDTVKPWREAQVGEWCLSDDGKICDVIARNAWKNTLTNKQEAVIRTLLGTRFISMKMQGDPKKDIYQFGDGGTYDRWKKRDELSQRDKEFASLISMWKLGMSDLRPYQAYMRAFKSNNEEYAKRNSKVLLTTKRIKKQVSKEIQDILIEIGADRLWIIRKMKSFIDDRKIKDTVRADLLKKLGEYAELEPTKQTQTAVLQLKAGFTKDDIEAFKENSAPKELSDRTE